MSNKKTISQKIARAVLKLFPDDCMIVKIELFHTEVIRKYIMRIEEGNKRAAKSKLKFHLAVGK